MIRALVAGTFALLLAWSGQAVAGPSPIPGVVQWAGMYFGAHVGLGSATKDWSLADSPCCGGGAGTFLGSGAGSGVLGGLQAGVNWQQDAILWGFQADVSFANINGAAANPGSPVSGNCWSGGDQTARCGTMTDWLASFTARVGALITPDTLFYAKGGVAFAHDTFSVTALTANGGCNPAGPDYAGVGQGRFGPTAGIGVEHIVGPTMTLFAEADVSDFGSGDVTFADTGDECSPSLRPGSGRPSERSRSA